MILDHDIPAGSYWSLRVRAGRVLRLTALDDGAVCSALVFAAADPVDRLNVPDTLKAQMSARIRPPMVLMSDRGAALATAVAAQAASQALVFVDRATPATAVVNGTLELVLPDWQWRRRTWQPHQGCSCGSCAVR